MFNNTVWLHVESTTRCNAWCPFCPRSKNGYGLADDLIVQDLSIDKLQNVCDDIPNIETIQFCGNLGDPLAAKNFDLQIDYALSNNKIKNIIINTNGSIRSTDWWKKLANDCKKINLQVWFAIDGNIDSHSYYRQGTSYNKIIDNASAFISEGGKAVWQYIIFEHNKDDLIECYNKSQELGFQQFKVIKNVRSDQQSLHYKTGKKLNIKNFLGDVTATDNEHHNFVFKKNCMHMSYPSLYLGANGKVSPCCYLYNENVTNKDVTESFRSKNFINTCLKQCGHVDGMQKTIQ